MWTRNNVTFVWVWFTWRKESHSIYIPSVSQALVFLVRHIQDVLKWHVERGRLLLRQFHRTNSFTKWEVWLSSLCPLLHALQWRQWVLFTSARAASSLVCSFSKLEASDNKANSNPGLQNPCSSVATGLQASNSSAKRKITILWFYFVGWSSFPSGPHTELLRVPR